MRNMGALEKLIVCSKVSKMKNTVLWNFMIAGFARHAHSLEVTILFEKMQQIGMIPNEVTYISVFICV